MLNKLFSVINNAKVEWIVWVWRVAILLAEGKNLLIFQCQRRFVETSQVFWEFKLNAVFITLNFFQIICASFRKVGMDKIQFLKPAILFNDVMPSIFVLSVVSETTV
jgi:hypothetical protein